MSQTMTKDERQAFLAQPHVGIISIPEAGRGPLTVPVWYAYEPGGEVCVWTGGSSKKAKLLRQASRFSLCIQQEKRPYKYVSVEGPIQTIDSPNLEQDLRPLVYRYLGSVEGDQFLQALGGDAAGTGDIFVRMKPERWLSVDYSKPEDAEAKQ